MEHSQFFTALRKLFEEFPGIGQRQANRFIWALLDFSESEQKELANAILALPKHMRRCEICFRVFSVKDGEIICSFCGPHSRRDQNKLMILEHDSDLLNMERAGVYRGLYHVLGDALDPLEKDGLVRERIKKLYERIAVAAGNENSKRGRAAAEYNSDFEIILALSPTKLGEFTSEYIKKVLEPITQDEKIKVTRLGRGLSTGVELEYADELTLKQALDNRK